MKGLNCNVRSSLGMWIGGGARVPGYGVGLARRWARALAVGALAAGCIATFPLHQAVRDGDSSRAELLIAEGADVNARNARGWSPLHLAAGQRDATAVSLVQVLIAKGADVNLKSGDALEVAPLHFAAAWGRRDVVELLVDRGAALDQKDAIGQTPLDWATGEGNAELAEWLRQQGAATGRAVGAKD